MNYKEERTIRAIRLLGFRFPQNKSGTIDTLSQISFENLSRIRSAYKENFEFYLNYIDKRLSEVDFYTCNVCEEEKSSFGEMPDKWGWYDTKGGWCLMCDKCQLDFSKRYNEVPIIVREV